MILEGKNTDGRRIGIDLRYKGEAEIEFDKE